MLRKMEPIWARCARTMASKTVTLVVDGQTLTAPSGALLIDVIRKAKIKVPTLCYNPRNPDSGGACKVCVVEDLARPGVPIMSCRTPVREGMKVDTKSEMILQLRETNRTIALKKHPALKVPKPAKKSEVPADTKKQDIASLAAKYQKGRREYTLPLAIDIADAAGYVGKTAIAAIAEHVGEDPAAVGAVLDRYMFLPREESQAGNTHVFFCTCHNCRMRGAQEAMSRLGQALGKSCTVHTVNWLGVCVNDAPAAMIKRPGRAHVEYLMGMDRIRTLELERQLTLRPENRVRFFPYSRFGAKFASLTAAMPFADIRRNAIASAKSGDEVVDKIMEAGLKGRGGGGFPTYLKWKSVRQARTDRKYVVCNADEGLPSNFKDWWTLSQPHGREAVLTGMAICAKVVGTKKAYLYLRYEYRNLAEEIKAAVKTLKEQTPEFADIDFEVRLGAGTYIAGEETAQFESIEGGQPIPRKNRPWYMYSTESGLFGQPTVINNVETFANVPYILSHDISQINEVGLPKLIGIVGDGVKQPLMLECSLADLTMEKILAEIGVPTKDVQAAEVGGATEPLTTDWKRRISFDKNCLSPVGSVVLFGPNRDLNQVYRDKLQFMSDEGCKQCVPCREGSSLMCRGLEQLARSGEKIDEKFFREVAFAAGKCGLCGHGKALGPLMVEAMERAGRKKAK